MEQGGKLAFDNRTNQVEYLRQIYFEGDKSRIENNFYQSLNNPKPC